MKLRIRRSNLKRAKKVGFRTRSKTVGGRKIIKRKRKRSGKFRVG
jgi:ribosomal protein L34